MESKTRNNRPGSFSRAHLVLFARSPLWWGAPLTAVVTFAIVFLIRSLGDGLPAAAAAAKGAIFGAVGAFSWAIGIWVATDPAPDEEEEPAPSRIPAWARRVLGVAIAAGAFALVCSPQIDAMRTGEASLARGFAGIVLKAIGIVAVLLPVYLSRRTK
ncbi:hypothetical protein [uncultured Alistipes sp.]|uniref:hypothetical protein n=1 Tax=uncultured Alistipes sp. TaxID=538949 RepID=UPI002636299A|nr:hypothetical protein [uncultured Alistipes sp.]